MLKVMTLNINFDGEGYGPWSARKELIAAAVQKADSDIIALQAVCQEPALDDGRDQASQLAERLPAYGYVLFQPATTYSSGRREGQALLAKLEPSEIHSLELSLRPGLEDGNKRILLHAVFELEDGPLHLYNAYFSWLEGQCLDNVDETLAYSRSFPGAGLLLGDMNMPPEGEPMRRLSESGWTDLWTKHHPGEHGYTFESGEPSKRIDYVWANQALKGQAEGIEVVADGCKGGVRPSDHVGLLARLSVV